MCPPSSPAHSAISCIACQLPFPPPRSAKLPTFPSSLGSHARRYGSCPVQHGHSSGGPLAATNIPHPQATTPASCRSGADATTDTTTHADTRTVAPPRQAFQLVSLASAAGPAATAAGSSPASATMRANIDPPTTPAAPGPAAPGAAGAGPAASSCCTGPNSATRPASMSSTRSASRMVLSRCAMASTVADCGGGGRARVRAAEGEGAMLSESEGRRPTQDLTGL